MGLHVEEIKAILKNDRELMQHWPKFSNAMEKYFDAFVLDLDKIEDDAEVGKRVRVASEVRKDIRSVGVDIVTGAKRERPILHNEHLR